MLLITSQKPYNYASARELIRNKQLAAIRDRFMSEIQRFVPVSANNATSYDWPRPLPCLGM